MGNALEHLSWFSPNSISSRRSRLYALPWLDRFSLSFVLIHLMVTILFAVSGYRFKSSADEELLNTRLSATLQVLPAVIGDDYLRDLLSHGPIDKQRYLAMLQRLSNYAKKAGVDSVYVLSRREGHTVFVVDSTDAGKLNIVRNGKYFERDDIGPPQLKSVFAQMIPAFADYHDRLGNVRSFFLPIIGPQDHQLVLGADVRLAAIDAERLSNLFLFLGIGLATFLLGVVIIASRELRVSQLVFEDPLTGLPNRARFLLDVNQTIKSRHKRSDELIVAIFNICDVKRINSLYGYADGNVLLQDVARRLAAVLKKSESLARLPSGDFALLLHGDQYKCLARLTRTLDTPVRLSALQSVTVRARLGLARYPTHGLSSQNLLCYAEVALDAARSQDTSYAFFDPELEQQRLHLMALVDDFDRALVGGQLRVFLQPKIRLSDGYIVGAEALVRWEHPRLGLLTPEAFLPIIEASGRICALSLWLLRECMQLSRRGNICISVNLSVEDLESPQFPAEVEALLAQTGAHASQLCLEITESSAMRKPEQVLLSLSKLRHLGCSLSIDDFGTGHSSLAYLARLPVDELKIDRSFINQLDLPEQQEVVKAIIQLASIMKLRLVAEGVEDLHGYTMLASFGCHEIQGYLVSKPIPALEYFRWLDERAGYWKPSSPEYPASSHNIEGLAVKA